MTMLVQSASRSAGLAKNSRQWPSPFSKLPAMTAMFGYTTVQTRSANTGERERQTFSRVALFH
jgi:hypothetical protein